MKNEKVKIMRRCSVLQKGQAMITAVVLLVFVSVAVMLGLGSSVIKDIKITGDFVKSKQSYLVAESGVEDAAYRIKNGKQITANETLALNGATTTTDITDIGSEKEILATGDIASSTRKVKMRLRLSTVGASFNYGIQVGAGGLSMSQNSGVNGNVYVNGSITGDGSGPNMSFITGTAVAANSIATTTDQTNDTPGTPSFDFTFGTTTPQDIAQSFQVSTTSPLNKISVYIKRTAASPGNLTVRIMSDNAGVPGTEITSGDLNAASVTTTYGWIDVTFDENPELIKETTYWFVLDGGSSATKYYTIGANADGYASGQLKKGTYNTTWNSTGGLDAYFKVYVGGFTATINNVKIGTAGAGDAKAHNVTGSTIEGALYCQTGSGNNKACDTSLPDPVPSSYAISEANIAQWKTDACDGSPSCTITGDYAPVGDVSLGPKHITGNLQIPKDSILTLTGTVWVEGTVSVENGAGNNTKVKLASGYGSDSGVLLADGKVDISNNVDFQNSGTSGSYILLLTTSDCPNGPTCGGAPAINVSNNVGAVLLDAPNGTLHFNNGSEATEATASRIELAQGAIVTYSSGLVDASFSSGPGGSFDISTWREVE